MQSNNRLLNALDKSTFSKLAPALIPVDLERGQEIAYPHQRVNRCYFPHSGVISCVVELPGGGAIETAMIGNDGQWGCSQALDDKVSLNAVVVQVAGQASAVEVDQFRQLATEHHDLRGIILRYEQFFIAQIQQTAACNAVHQVEQRLCKWLLRLNELVGADFPITQDFMAQMMGVRRTSVTNLAGQLQRAGAISYSRGQMHIVDAAILEARACECPAELREHYAKLFGHPERTSSD